MITDHKALAKSLNEEWNRCVECRREILKSAIDYNVNVLKGDVGSNPFNSLIDRYDLNMLDLMYDLNDKIVDHMVGFHAPNIAIAKEPIVHRMVDTLTDEHTETTRHGKPLVFDADWVLEYLNVNYLEHADEICEKQMLMAIRMSITQPNGDFDLSLYINDRTLTMPLKTYKTNTPDHYIVDEDSSNLMITLDKFIDALTTMERYSYGSVTSLSRVISSWSAMRVPSYQIFVEHKITDDWSWAESFKVLHDRQEIEIVFKDKEVLEKLSQKLS